MQREPYSEGYTCLGQFEDPHTLSGATVFMHHGGSSNELVIACRGSANAKNFQTNLDIGPAPLAIGPPSASSSTARVHAGFQKASQQLWRQIEPYVMSEAPTRPVLVTGHSLGGGVATLLALHARAAGLQPELITVAGPRLGDAAFRDHYRKQCYIPAVHLVHDDDEVLTSNKGVWDDLGFEHVGYVQRCDKDTPCLFDAETDDGTCEVGNAVKGAAAPFVPPSLKGIFIDHCMYLGLYIGVRLEHPSVWLRAPWA